MPRRKTRPWAGLQEVRKTCRTQEEEGMLLVYNSHRNDFLKTWVVCYVYIVAKDRAGEGCSM